MASQYCLRVVSKVSVLCFWLLCNNQSLRCDATPGNLDDPNAQRHFHEKTDYFFKHFDPNILWNKYGIQFDVVVRSHLILDIIFYLC
jgi:hypothetical protein